MIISQNFLLAVIAVIQFIHPSCIRNLISEISKEGNDEVKSLQIFPDA